MSRKLLLIKEKQVVWTALYENGRLLALDGSLRFKENEAEFSKKPYSPLIGDIYIGRVGNIVKNIKSAFVDIKGGFLPVYLDLNAVEALTYENGPIFTKKINEPPSPFAPVKVHQDDELMVQIVKEGTKTKRAAVSCNIQFPGNYLILIHGRRGVSISSKIKDKKKRDSLKELAETLIDKEEGAFGFIVRTNAESALEQDILEEGRTLINRYGELISYGKCQPAGTRLYREPPPYLLEIRNLNQKQLEEIIVEDEGLYKEVRDYLKAYIPSFLDKLSLYKDEMISLDKLYGFQNKLNNALKNKVWLKSGAYLVIEPTEAMVVIDVNTGKSITGKKSKEETIFRTNMEAAEEIAFQLRLRNLSGIIIIDFIDMESEEHKRLLLKFLNELFLQDSVHTCLVDITALNLVEVTRKKIRRPLYEIVRELQTIPYTI